MGLNTEGEGVVEARPTEVVERVASALRREALLVSAEQARGKLITDGEYQTRLARSAIEAMEPTMEMVDAGLAAFLSHDRRVCDPRDTVEEIIREAITAALSPSGGRE